MAKILFNKIKIGNKIGTALKQPRFEKFAYNAANLRFQIARTETMKDFDEHVITKELKEGATAEESVLGYGNLAAFLGLPDSTASVADVRKYLYDNFDLIEKPRFTQNKSSVTYEFKVEAPKLTEIYEAFDPPPDSYGRSWVSVIENGMGNFSYFVFRLLGFPKSRSGTGLQRKKKRDWVDIPNTSPKIKWISEILENFRSYFKSK